jgi:hypothetical protein
MALNKEAIMDRYSTVPKMFIERVSRHPEKVAMRYKYPGYGETSLGESIWKTFATRASGSSRWESTEETGWLS